MTLRHRLKQVALSASTLVLLLSTATSTSYASSSMTQDHIYFNGQLVSSPFGRMAIDPNSHEATTYIPIAYVMAMLLKELHISSTWNGHLWNLHVPTNFTYVPSHIASPHLKNTTTITIDNQPYIHVPSLIGQDPYTHNLTTYVPIYDIEQLLIKLGVPNNWNGSVWSVAPPAHTAEASTLSNSEQTAVTYHQLTVDGVSVASLYVDINNPHVIVKPVIADNHFGQTASLTALAQSVHAIAAVNGTYFDALSTMWPAGSLFVNGQWIHTDGGTLMGFGAGGKVIMTRATESLWMTIGNRRVWPWKINSWHGQPTEISILTRLYGHSTHIANGTAVVVQHGVVTAITYGNTSIPEHGYVVEWGNSPYNQNFLQNVHLGQLVQSNVTVYNQRKQPVNFSGITQAIGAGPMLVNHGQIVLDPASEGFTSTSLIDSQTSRTLIGITQNHTLVLAVLSSATMQQEALIARDMGLIQAMNLDGGASSGIYFHGQSLIAPTRNLATALAVIDQ
ncbi:phosphodiester glycosidase family protein [Sulfoacidibacillus ferrooxidans]|uniref:Phosphodiester glycosidase domain-containing protein n=1 Tax=Sulfoacidibacillus ferrooxidans TaxID=2005001 RepID=A0A9X2ADC0_9BACL|nr:phosphodiester glycosidase family protein [Sulfoacidibacillus ferrooxidans]MCI0182187.1 hypothetical protein [Sulfoacidibacillus ferrooxidans]